MVDLDDLQLPNDTHGHVAGGTMLEATGQPVGSERPQQRRGGSVQ